MPRKPDLRLGIDVGGTNTDAVILDLEDRVVARSKQSTTTDVTSGIQAAIAAVALVGNHDVVERAGLGAAAGKTNHDHFWILWVVGHRPPLHPDFKSWAASEKAAGFPDAETRDMATRPATHRKAFDYNR